MESVKQPAAWLPGTLVSHFIRFICPEGFQANVPAGTRTLGMAVYWAAFMLSMTWLKLVSENVPDAYLDEIFHIPQAQLYCQGVYDYWDPKLTTPPGLYIFVTIFTKLRFGSWDVFGLRLFNATVLPVTMIFALSCRHFIYSSSTKSSPTADTIHTALNIALFPPLFFFSGLFYTDLLSTCVVLITYRLFLRSSNRTNWAVFPVGLVALTMRQTNIFWVAVFLGGLEAVRTVSQSPVVKKGDDLVPGPWKERAKFEFDKWSRGNVHDIALADAGIFDCLLCVLSIIVAAVYQPVRTTLRLLPCLALLLSFVAFVIWNGGVVLGDKSNHVATIHLPQLLYLCTFTALFSVPLLITPTLRFLRSVYDLVKLPLFPKLEQQYLLTTIYTVGALGLTLVIIKYNTIIHPFTLADNRHYVFYAFRYTILRHPLIKYILAPIYLICGWAVYLTLCGSSSGTVPRSYTSNSKSKDTPTKLSSKLTTSKDVSQNSQIQRGPKTSFLIIFLLTTALSLITAPLVEPRYFIIPWVIWRLHVPSLPPATPPPTSNSNTGSNRSFLDLMRFWGYKKHDYRLWLETAYFIVINAVVGYIFLYRGFSWEQEPGKVQRFMW